MWTTSYRLAKPAELEGDGVVAIDGAVVVVAIIGAVAVAAVVDVVVVVRVAVVAGAVVAGVVVVVTRLHAEEE